MTLKSLTPLLTAAGLVLAVASTGCTTTPGNPQLANQDRNFLGIIKIEPKSYARTDPTTIELHTDQLITQPDPNGTRVTLLAGLITFEDY